MDRTRLCFITEWFPPEPALAPLWIAQAMRDENFQVGVVTGTPHYPDGKALAGYSTAGRRVETIEGFNTLRVPEYPSHDQSVMRRMATFGSFALSGVAFASKAIGHADVSLVYSSPATSALPAMAARMRYGTPYVLLVQDLWPDSIFATGFLQDGLTRRWSGRAVGTFVDQAYRCASHVCVITPGMRRTLIERGVPAGKVSVVFNWVDESILKPVDSDNVLRGRLGLSESAFIALFSGNAGEAQGLMAWIEAMSLLCDEGEAHLVFLGGGTQRQSLQEAAHARGIQGLVHFVDAVPASEVPPLVADADVSIVSLADQELFRITMPSKIQACMAMASPVIASCAGDVADVVRASGAGWVASPEDPRSIANAIREARRAGVGERRQRGLLGRRYYDENLGRSIGAGRLGSALRTAVAHGGPRFRRRRDIGV